MRNAHLTRIRLVFHEQSDDLVLQVLRDVWTPVARLVHEESDTLLVNGDRRTGSRPEVELRGDDRIGRARVNIGDRYILREFSTGESEDLLHVAVEYSGRPGDLIARLLDVWYWEAGDLDFQWTPILRPEADYRIADYIFRSPALIAGTDGIWLAIIPDLDLMSDVTAAGQLALDLNVVDAVPARLAYGFEPTRPTRHVYFERDPKGSVSASSQGVSDYGYYLMIGLGTRRGFLRRVTAFMWNRFARPRSHEMPDTVTPEVYAQVAYPTLLREEWVDFKVNGVAAGGIKALAAHADYFRRPDPIVWNQVWFNAQRSAFGLGYYGHKAGRPEWFDAGKAITAWSLAAPDWSGLFPAVYAYDVGEWWGSVPRLNGGKHRIHIPNAVWTAIWLLRWHQNLEADARIPDRVFDVARALSRLQDEAGAIPSWVDIEGGAMRPAIQLQRAAPTGASAMLFGELARAAGRTDLKGPLERACDFLEREVLPAMRWWDFETFYSCSRKPLDFFDRYTDQPPQNTYSMFWAARSFLDAYRVTRSERWLSAALEVVDWLSLYQQVWDAPFLSLNTYGGFGVMNTDAEWNDARQAVFAPLYFELFEVTGEKEYRERGLAALKASFVLGAVPENEKVSPFTFDAYPPGLMPENFAHAGVDRTHGRSDSGWGEAGALATAAWISVKFDHDPATSP
jgi:hypothetical protein